MGTKYRNFGGKGTPFSRKPPLPRNECSFKGAKITSKKELDEYLSGDSIQCLICGDYFTHVSTHVFNKHGVTAKDYKTEFGIPQKTGIITKALKKTLSDNWSQVVGMDKRKQEQDSGDLIGDVSAYLTERLAGFIEFVKECNENEISIYKANASESSKVHAHIRKYKDKDLINVVNLNGEFSYDERPAVISVCANKNCNNEVHTYSNKVKDGGNFCSRKCDSESRKSERLEKPCITCGRIMLLTKGNYNRISRCCGKKSNSSSKGSAINFKDELKGTS